MGQVGKKAAPAPRGFNPAYFSVPIFVSRLRRIEKMRNLSKKWN
jgi:hypothetical protein